MCELGGVDLSEYLGALPPKRVGRRVFVSREASMGWPDGTFFVLQSYRALVKLPLRCLF